MKNGQNHTRCVNTNEYFCRIINNRLLLTNSELEVIEGVLVDIVELLFDPEGVFGHRRHVTKIDRIRRLGS